MVSPSEFSSNTSIMEDKQDLISNLPNNVIDKIIEILPLSDAAKMGVLSRNWRNYWLNLGSLVFDADFSKSQRDDNGKLDWSKYHSIISNILFRHHGHIHTFRLYIPKDKTVCEETLNFSPWLSFLSRNGVKKLVLLNQLVTILPLPSYIFSFKLEEMTLGYFTLNPPLADFKRFERLWKLVLCEMKFNIDIGSLIANCPNLARLKLMHCTGINHLAIDAPKLKNLTLKGKLGSLDFKNVPTLVILELAMEGEWDNRLCTQLADAFKNIATSCKLTFLQIGLSLSKFLAAGGIMRSLPLALTQVTPSKNLDVRHKYSYDNKFKLDHLLEVEFEGITGSRAEVKLIEYVLSVSNVLENLFILLGKLDYNSAFALGKELNGLERASPKISTNVEGRHDRISNLPVVLADKILELLPLNEAAKMSVLSKQWRTNWCCLKKLVFNTDFWDRQSCNCNDVELEWETYTSIVSNIFLHHLGPYTSSTVSSLAFDKITFVIMQL
ncbi:F-box/FBD/LRR-repeat protein At1g13570-like [Chenopodium quinoa]|uniref:F-box domain-containing protein n=1 Tax=Chenopodium quinoa TaxID=63459 RepID=A0A803L7F5_CHEQI|nr:F-box/FBD/LRR-repeat protein At1g13570-like [Chenopodium quinoa]